MLNLPRIFRKAPASHSESDPAKSGTEAPTSGVPATEGRATIPIVASDDPEVAELDRLYREALDAMEVIDVELNRANELLLVGADDDASDAQSDSSSIAPTSTAVFQTNAASKGAAEKLSSAIGPRVTPAQIIEAALFVGGGPLTIKRLCTLLKGEFEQSYVEETVEQLNQQYAAEERPYEIRFGTGGYRMELRDSFEAVQNRVFGIGPKDVKLGQEALEILSLVAYQQPVTKETLDSHVKDNSGTILRQLLQRELIALRRPDETGDAQEVTYHTTSRFLQVFGLADLNELPQAEELSFK